MITSNIFVVCLWRVNASVTFPKHEFRIASNKLPRSEFFTFYSLHLEQITASSMARSFLFVLSNLVYHACFNVIIDDSINKDR